ncbi:MAG: pyridoxamine 5'-phosphate oxidase family protein [Streptosporangiaceae bacterium]
MTIAEDAISEQECWYLLATASVGRLALSVRALPMILHVQYYLDDRNITACLGHRELPERSLDEAIIAFAADSIDPWTRSGWSVEVQGRSVLSREAGLDPTCSQHAPGQVVRIEPTTLTGHRVHLCPLIDQMRASSRR